MDPHTNTESAERTITEARLVARGFVSDAVDRDTLFSGTPGLPVVRSLISRVATAKPSGMELKMMLKGVTAAFLYGFSETSLFWRFPIRIPRHEILVLLCAVLVRDL